MTQPERIWAKEGYDSWGSYGDWYEDDTGGGTEYIRADVAKAMVDAERERCATLCETREMGVVTRPENAKWAGVYVDGPRVSFGKNAGMAYAEMIRATK